MNEIIRAFLKDVYKDLPKDVYDAIVLAKTNDRFSGIVYIDNTIMHRDFFSNYYIYKILK